MKKIEKINLDNIELIETSSSDSLFSDYELDNIDNSSIILYNSENNQIPYTYLSNHQDFIIDIDKNNDINSKIISNNLKYYSFNIENNINKFIYIFYFIILIIILMFFFFIIKIIK